MLAPRTWSITGGVVALALVGGTAASNVLGPEPGTAPTSPVFAGTALEGARLTGRLAGVIDTYGAQLMNLYRQNEEFYAGARTTLRATWDGKAAQEAAAAAVQPPVPPSGTPEPTPAVPVLAADAEQAEPVTLLVISDLHCNTSMVPLIRDVAERAEVDVILNAGDTTMNGTAVERVCVDSFARTRPKGVPMVVANGNHDSQVVADAERAQGMIVLDGSVVDVGGVRILGDRDAHETRVGVGTTAIADESTADAGRRLAETACEAGDVDLLLIHTPSAGDAGLQSGCVPFQVSGHTHSRVDPFVVGQGIRYVNASTAGAASGQPTVGPLSGTAEMTLLRFDPAERRVTQWKLVEVLPDGSAEVSAWQEVPPRPEPVVRDQGVLEETGSPSPGATGSGGSAESTATPDGGAAAPTAAATPQP